MGDVVFECWAYKRGGSWTNPTFKKRYFVITSQHSLQYYKTPEEKAKNTLPKGSLSCIGMIVKNAQGTQKIDKKDCFTFTLQAKQGSRTSDIECACETSDQRDTLLEQIKNHSTRVEGSATTAVVMGTLSGYVVQGRNLARADLLDKSDPYAVIRLKGSIAEYKTQAEMNVDSPMWRFPIPPTPVPEGCFELEVEVWDYNAWTAHKPLGRCTVQLQDVMAARGTKIDQWHPLDTQGEVKLVLAFLPEGQNPHLRNPSFVDREKGSGGVLTITVKKAVDVRQSVDDNLRTGGLLGFTKDIVDPFVIVSYRDKSYRTTTVYNNYNPQWNETLRFFVKDGGKEALERQVRFAMYDREQLTKAPCLSVCNVRLGDLIGTEGQAHVQVSVERDLLPNAARWGAKFTDGPVMGSLSFVASFEPFVDAEKRFWLENFETIDIDQSGDLGLPEFCEFVRVVSGKDLAEDDLKRLFQAANTNNDDVVDIGELSSFLAEMRGNGLELIDHDLFESWLEATTSMVEAGMVSASNESEAQEKSTGGFLSSLSDWNCDESYSKGLRVGAKARHILVWNRETQIMEEEIISSSINLAMRMLYQGTLGALLRKTSSVTAAFKRMSIRQGQKYDDPASAGHIQHFVDIMQINMEEAVLAVPAYKTFNEWFFRKLKPEARPIKYKDNPAVAIQPCDCRLMVFPTFEDATKFWIKGKRFTIENLLEDPELAKHFEGGSISVHRLAPQDYHRYHLPIDDCSVVSQKEVGMHYWTVNPVAVNAVDVFTENKRVVSILQSPVFGKVAFISVGAHMVASIEFTIDVGGKGSKGDDYGFFKFGGSTVVCVWEKDAIVFDADLVAQSAESTEVLVKLGQSLGTCPRDAGAAQASK